MSAPADTKQETQVCDLCGCASYQIFATRGRWRSRLTTVICQDCGLVYSNPRPTEEENAEFYHREYWGMYKSQSKPNEKFFQRRLPKIKSMLAELAEHLRPGVRVLEIGSGAGALLWSIKRHCNDEGEFIGIEPHAGHAKYCRERKKLDVRPGLLEEVVPTLPKKHFDLVVMNHVLEHTVSPTWVFETVRKMLKPGGVFVVEVPNVNAPGSRLSHFFHVAHHFNFSPRTLEHLAGKTGYTVGRVDELDGDLPKTRLFGVFINKSSKNTNANGALIDDPDERAQALLQYDRWYWRTLASLRKKFTHWQRQRM